MTESTLIDALKAKDKDFEETVIFFNGALKCPNCDQNKVEAMVNKDQDDCYFCQACGETFEVCWHCGDWNGEKNCYYCDPS